MAKRHRLYDPARRDLTAAGLALAVALLCAVRLLLASQGRLYLEPENSPIDDQRMYEAACSITAGQWLGPYAYNTLAKHMFFSIWLAGIHALGLPYLVAEGLMWLAGAWVMAAALRPLLQKRAWVLAAFAMLAMCPVGMDRFTLRVYRDSITVPLLLLMLGGFIGAMTRCHAALHGGGGRRCWAAAFGFAAVGGLGLGAGWLNREDGVWMLPFCSCFVLLGGAVLLRRAAWRGRLGAVLCLLLPFGLLGGCVGGYAAANRHFYGRAIVSDLTSRDFTTAYGLLVGMEDAGSGRLRPLSRAARQTLYDNSAFFAALQPWWESPFVLNGYGNVDSGEYGGSLYYALRLANQFAGHYTDAVETMHFYEQMAEELRRLDEAGVISIRHATRSTVPYWRGEYLAPTLRELGSSVGMSLFLTGYDPRPAFSIYSRSDLVEEILQYLGGDIVRGYAAGTDRPYYNLLQRAAYLAQDIVGWLWRLACLPCLLVGLWWGLAACRRCFGLLGGRKKAAAGWEEYLCWVLLWGFALSALLRCALVAYMEVTVFGIGTYLMYLAAAVPLWGLCGLLGVRGLTARRKEERQP